MGFTLLSSNSFRVIDALIKKKMSNASMQLHKKVIHDDTVEYWDNELEKPALVLLHGFGATTRYQWFRQVEMLSKNYRVILPNLLHFGNSSPSKEK